MKKYLFMVVLSASFSAYAQFGNLLNNIASELAKAAQQDGSKNNGQDVKAPAAPVAPNLAETQRQQEADARLAREAAETKRLQDIEAAEAKRKQEEERVAKAKEEQAAKEAQEKAQEKKEGEARKEALAQEKKTAWPKAHAYVKEAGVKWTLKTQKDAMTGKDNSYAFSVFKTPDGSESAEVRVSCEDSTPGITFIINRFKVATQYNRQYKALLAEGRIKFNETIGTPVISFNESSSNEFNLGAFVDDKFQPKNLAVEDGLFFVYTPFQAGSTKQYVHALMVELQTKKGPILAKIAAFEPSLYSVLKVCK
jgi:hypothetical protein